MPMKCDTERTEVEREYTVKPEKREKINAQRLVDFDVMPLEVYMPNGAELDRDSYNSSGSECSQLLC